MEFADISTVEALINSSPPGKNTKFLKAAHSLWYRFKNYGSNPPMVLREGDEIVSLIFATFNRDGYTNLYEIVTVEGQEGKGYASKIWDMYIHYAYNIKGSKRLKLSCTPSSLSWHLRNGLVFWSVDPSGSLRSDQILLPTREEQKKHREEIVKSPAAFLPPIKSREKMVGEDPKFGKSKGIIVEEAIQKAGKYWLRSSLFNEL